MKLIQYSLVVLLLLGAITQNEVVAIRVNEASDPAPAEKKSPAEEAGDAIVRKTVEGADKGEDAGRPTAPYCSLEGKECREREGYKKSDDEGNDEDLEEPKGMPHTVAPIKANSESNKASKGEPKELIVNGTVKVEMAKWFPNREKLKRINETKEAIKKEEEKREKDKKQREDDRKEKKKERAKAKVKAQLLANQTETANKKAQAQQTNSTNSTAQTNQAPNPTAVASIEKPVQASANAPATPNAPTNSNPTPTPVQANQQQVAQNANVATEKKNQPQVNTNQPQVNANHPQVNANQPQANANQPQVNAKKPTA